MLFLSGMQKAEPAGETMALAGEAAVRMSNGGHSRHPGFQKTPTIQQRGMQKKQRNAEESASRWTENNGGGRKGHLFSAFESTPGIMGQFDG